MKLSKRHRPFHEARRHSTPETPDSEALHDYIHTHPFDPASFDVIASVATLHHMDAATGLARMRDLVGIGA